MGVSPRVLAGFVPATVTSFEYDDDGRVSRTVAVTESVWSPDDVALLIASRQREREYGPHGFLMSEATDPANEHAFVGLEKPRVDFAEKARLDGAKAYYDKWDKKDNPVNRNGHIWVVSKP